MAVIVLSGADFSENNIGKIDLFRGFHAMTKSLFSDFGIVEDESNMMQREVDLFVRTLINANIWGNDKINGLCLPFLANLSSTPSLAKAVLNCIDTTKDFFDNSYSSKLELKNNGLVTLRTGENRITINTTDMGTKQNFHFASFSLEDEPIEYTSSEQTKVVTKSIYTGSPFTSLRTDCVLTVAPSVNLLADQNYANKACMMIVEFKQNENNNKGIYYVNGQGVSTANEFTTTDGALGTWYFGKYSNPYLSANNYPIDSNPANPSVNGQVKAPYGLLSIGKYLTSAEIDVYNTAASKLIAAVHTYMDN